MSDETTTTSGAGLAAVAGLVAGLAGGVAISGGDSVELATPPPAMSSVEVVPAHLRQVVETIDGAGSQTILAGPGAGRYRVDVLAAGSGQVRVGVLLVTEGVNDATAGQRFVLRWAEGVAVPTGQQFLRLTPRVDEDAATGEVTAFPGHYDVAGG